MYAPHSEDFFIGVNIYSTPTTEQSTCSLQSRTQNITAIKQEINLVHKFDNLEEFEDFPYQFERSDHNVQGHDESGVATLGGTDVLPCLLCIFHL